MKWGSSISRALDTAQAVALAIDAARTAQGGDRVDVVLAFFSPHHAAGAPAAHAALQREFPDAVIAGCSAQSCIGGGVEVEQEPGFSLTLGHTPGASFHPFAVSPAAAARAGAQPDAWRALVGLDPATNPGFVLLGDPFTGDTESLLRGLAAAYPGAVQVGGLASGAREPGGESLLLGDACFSTGYVGLALTGDVEIDTVVAQGCRPIGQPMFVTRCEQNVIYELDGRPPLEVLTELANDATERELSLFQTSLFVGLQMNPASIALGRGDFLVRNVAFGDRESGALAIGALVRARQVVQFHLRDGETAAEDLALRLARHAADHPRPSAALMFSCLGRGRGMYGVPNHDSDALRRHFGDVSISGFFGNGEIGPVDGAPYLHGYTSAIALLRASARFAR